jgi:molecular chaperone DnaK (HSP70)
MDSRGNDLPGTYSEAMEHPRPPPPTMNGTAVRDIQETRLVIGLDYGTTYTGRCNRVDSRCCWVRILLTNRGVAFATPKGTKCMLREITVMQDWGPQMTNLGKIPSVISYSRPSEALEQQWGSNLSPSAVSMVHTKLELGVQDVIGELDMTIQVLDGMKNLSFADMMAANDDHNRPAYTDKSPEDIVTDYLTKVFAHLDESVRVFNNAFKRQTVTDLVVTVPTVLYMLL